MPVSLFTNRIQTVEPYCINSEPYFFPRELRQGESRLGM